MKSALCILMLAVTISDPAALQAQEQDEKALQELSRTYVQAWNRRRMSQLAGSYALDANLTTPAAETVRGREAIGRELADEAANGRELALAREEYRWLTADLVAWRYEWKLRGGSGGPLSGVGLALLRRGPPGWQIIENLMALSPPSVTQAPADQSPR